ncbi:interactor of HORMAD1 protein 1 [Salminus brasiliensis]|uniref:interactor of HORMAD1 protein 1 n=1 Tax=Salminus brasiliensis TaxID=930266 RepID=UPI003B82D66A
MKPNVWNIKEILNIPSTSSGKGGKTSDYCNLSDSQFLFGSQFWPENSQSFSQEMSGPSRGSQPASQEINELKVSTSYHSKPLLFGDGKATHITGGKTLGMLDRFEEDKRKAKENEVLTHGFRQLHESLENIKRTFLNFVDGSCDLTKNVVAEGLDGLRKTIQDDLANIKEHIASQAEMLVSLQNQTKKEMKDIEAKTTLAVKNLSSLVLSLQQDLESLRIEQSKEQSVFGEIQSLLGTIIAAQSAGACPRPARMTDNTVQTSPGFVGKCCVISEEKRCCEGMRLCSGGITHSEERGHWDLCHVKAKSPEKLNTGASFPVTDDLDRSYVVRAPVHVKPLTDVEENRFTTWAEVPRQRKMPKRGQRSQNFRRKKRALILPQRRSNDRMASGNIFEDSQYIEEKENRVPLSTIKTDSNKRNLSTQHQGAAGLTCRSECGQHLNSWAWSQSSSSSEMMVEYKKAEQEMVMSEHKTNTIVRQRGIWQLFDFISDSD